MSQQKEADVGLLLNIMLLACCGAGGGQAAGGPGPLEVVAAAVAVDVEDFAAGIEAGH